jgi:exonuclease III
MDPSKIPIWNVRGLNASARQDAVRAEVVSSGVDVVCLQETKMQDISRFLVIRMLGPDFANFVFRPSIGASGGILVAWKDHINWAGVSRVDDHSMSIIFHHVDDVEWWLTCVYGPQLNQDKIAFLQELRDIRASCSGPWLVLGDFNLIYKDEDKNNSNLDRPMMHSFRRWIDDLALKELPLVGRKFTWSNGQHNPTLVKLDRVFCSLDWDDQFPWALLQSSSSFDSDHCPLLLGLKDIVHGKPRFHFEAFWTKLDGFLVAVEEAWAAVPASHCPLLTLSKKLKATAKALQGWGEKKVGHIRSQLGLAKELLHQLDIAQESRSLSHEEFWLRNNLKQHSLALASLWRSLVRMRSRICWLKDGDANSAYFTLMRGIAKLRASSLELSQRMERFSLPRRRRRTCSRISI